MVARFLISRIISGGQTGADQGALFGAKSVNFATGGWAPKGWMTDEGPQEDLLKGFGLLPFSTPGYPPRTRANVIDAQATVIFGKKSPGVSLTERICLDNERPYLWYPFPAVDTEEAIINELREMIFEQGVITLNVAGNRERLNPGIKDYVAKIISQLIESTRAGVRDD